MKPNPSIAALVIDMDGVLWRESIPLEGLKPFFVLLERHQVPYILATNNATQSAVSYARRLDRLDVKVDPERILSSGLAASLLMPDHCPVPGPLYVIGSSDLREIFTDRGYELTDHGPDAQAVVVGFDRDLSWHKLAEAALALNAGAFFMGTNPDVSFPSERGLVPGNGAQLAALTAATGVEPMIVGKPKPTIYELAMQRLGTTGDETLAVGDRLETDILGGIRAGLKTALLLTGVSSRSDLDTSPVQPNFIFQDLPALTAFLGEIWDA
ncbi:MAG: HAD-IIA family hydrolase [Anaerolineales bacterium]|jgi:4-nitrophenyl phosphatase